MHEILVRPVLSFHLAFGLDWLPLISGRPAGAARSIARRHRASHVVIDGEAPASFGYGLLRASARPRGRTVHSAAQNVARLYPSGSVAAIVPIDPDGHWLVAVHEGAVMVRTDVVYRSPEQAAQALHALQRAHPRLTVLGPETDGLSLEAIAGSSAPGTALRDTGRRHRQWLLGAFVAAASLLAWAALKNAGAARVDRAEPPALGPQEILSRWNAAVDEAEQGMRVHGVAATHAVLRHLYGMPAVLAGWTLLRVTCSADGRSWRCGADYDRRRRGANNEGLLAAAPQAWRIDFPSIDRASASWSFHAGALDAGRQRIVDAAQHRRQVQSAWQGIKSAFGRMALGPPARIEVGPPLDADGRPLPRPAGLRSHALRRVEFEGPLRSASLLLPYTQSIAWRSITLAPGEPLPPTLASSRLRATFHGDLYERYEADEPGNPAAAHRAAAPAASVDDGLAGRNDVLDGRGGRAGHE